MALGDIVQVGTRVGSGSSSSFSPTCSAAVAGNLLVAYGTVTASRTATTPAGWTAGPTVSSSALSTHTFWKEAAGGETGVTIVLSSSNAGYYNIIEIDSGTADLSAVDASAEDESNVATPVSSQASGTAVGTATDGIAFAVFGQDNLGTVNNGRAYTNSFTERDTSDTGNTSRGGYTVASKVITGNSNSSVFSNTEGSQEMYGAILVFGVAGAPSFAIDTPPASIAADTQASVVVSNPDVTPTTGNTEVKFDDDSGTAATVDSVTGSDPYTINFTFSRLTAAKQFDATGYPLYVETTADNATTAAIPYNEPVGYDFTDLVSPVTTSGSILEGYTGDTPVTGDQVVYTTPTDPDSIGFTVGADGEWILDSTPSADQTVERYVIQANGTVGVEDTATFSVTEPNVPPTISAIANQTIFEDTSTDVLNFTVTDPDGVDGDVTVTGVSSNTALVPNVNIVLGGSGSSRTVQVTPNTSTTGVTTITLTADDGEDTADELFTVTVDETPPPGDYSGHSNIGLAIRIGI